MRYILQFLTINILSCYLPPDSGKAEVSGYDVVKEQSDVKKHIGIAPQENIYYKTWFILS